MYTPIQRLTLIAVFVILGLINAPGSPLVAGLLILTATLMTWGHFRYGPVWLAVRALRRGEFSRARRLVESVRWPHTLDLQNRAYFEMVKGMLAVEAGNLPEAQQHLRGALDGSLRTSNDRAVVASHLAAVTCDLGDRASARAYLDRARLERHKAGLDAMIEQVGRSIAAD